jgi:hypothetical protein
VATGAIQIACFKRDVRLFLGFPVSLVVLASYCHVYFYVISISVLSRLFFPFTRGAPSPEEVKPAANGGQSGIFGPCICLLFVID